MTMQHTSPGELIDIRPLGHQLSSARTSTLARTNELEIIRLILPEGRRIHRHKVDGAITVQCLEGRVEFHALGTCKTLEPGYLLFLPSGELHSVKCIEHSSLLITIHLATEHVTQQSAAGLLLSRFGHDPEDSELD